MRSVIGTAGSATLAPGEWCDVEAVLEGSTNGFHYFQTNPTVQYVGIAGTATLVLPLVQYRSGAAAKSDVEAMTARFQAP